MPTRPDDHDHAALEAFFDAARRTTPVASEDMLARVLADAETVRTAAQARRTRPVRPARLRDLLGGWPSMAGLAAATLAGLWIGAGLPEAVPGTSEALYLVDITPEMAFGLTGGDD
jgi:hypothetical protein